MTVSETRGQPRVIREEQPERAQTERVVVMVDSLTGSAE